MKKGQSPAWYLVFACLLLLPGILPAQSVSVDPGGIVGITTGVPPKYSGQYVLQQTEYGFFWLDTSALRGGHVQAVSKCSGGLPPSDSGFYVLADCNSITNISASGSLAVVRMTSGQCGAQSVGCGGIRDDGHWRFTFGLGTWDYRGDLGEIPDSTQTTDPLGRTWSIQPTDITGVHFVWHSSGIPSSPPFADAVGTNLSAGERGDSVNYYGDRWQLRDISSGATTVLWDFNYTGSYRRGRNRARGRRRDGHGLLPLRSRRRGARRHPHGRELPPEPRPRQSARLRKLPLRAAELELVRDEHQHLFVRRAPRPLSAGEHRGVFGVHGHLLEDRRHTDASHGRQRRCERFEGESLPGLVRLDVQLLFRSAGGRVGRDCPGAQRRRRVRAGDLLPGRLPGGGLGRRLAHLEPRRGILDAEPRRPRELLHPGQRDGQGADDDAQFRGLSDPPRSLRRASGDPVQPAGGDLPGGGRPRPLNRPRLGRQLLRLLEIQLHGRRRSRLADRVPAVDGDRLDRGPVHRHLSRQREDATRGLLRRDLLSVGRHELLPLR